MRLDFDDLAQQQLVAIPDQMVRARHPHTWDILLGQANVLHMGDFQAGHGQALGEQFYRVVDVDVVFEP